jgi:hypothetical protein
MTMRKRLNRDRGFEGVGIGLSRNFEDWRAKIWHEVVGGGEANEFWPG